MRRNNLIVLFTLLNDIEEPKKAIQACAVASEEEENYERDDKM